MNDVSMTAETAFPIPAGVFAETVVSVKHYTDRLFAFRMTRPASFPLPLGRVRYDWPAERREAGLSRLFHRIAELGRGTGVLFDQGSGWPADRAPAKDPAGRHDPDAQEAGRHAGQRCADWRRAAVALLDRHRDRAVCLGHPRPGDLREVPAGHPLSYLPRGGRAGIRLRDGRRRQGRSAGGRGGDRAADPLCHDDARAEPAHGPDHRS